MTATSPRKIKTMWMLLLFLIISGLSIGVIWFYNKLNNVKSELSDLILSNPESTSVVAYTFDKNGELVDDGQTIFYNADKPLVVASVMKTVVLAAYADAVSNNEINPNENIPIGDVEKYYLPMTDGGAHAMGLKSLGLEADDYGFARNQSGMVTLDEIARIMIHYSGNAETDYLITRLGFDRISFTIEKCGLNNHTPIYYTLGFALETFNHENPSFSIDQIQSLVDQVSSGNTSQMEKFVELYLHNTEWRTEQIEFMSSLKNNSLSGLEMWDYQTRAAQLMPKGTAREYAHMMAKIASGKLISPEVSKIMQDKLESVQSDWILRAFYYDRFGAKDGMTAGVLSLASYETPKRGELHNLSRVVVIITNQLPPEKWVEQAQYQGHYLLPIDLAQATGEFNKFSKNDN